MNIRLSDAAKALGSSLESEKIITRVSIDSRESAEGTLFFAIKGDRFDGHDFIGDVAAKGAAAVVCSKKTECPVPVIYVDDTKSAFLSFASWYRQSFKNLKVAGLTGSVGKTTTKEMIACVLGSQYKTLKTEGNLNNEIGVPKTLFRLDESYDFAVVEMGMDNAGQIEKLSRCALPDCAVITNIGVSHIENLGSREAILNAKLEILKGMKKGSLLFLNGDNDMLCQVHNPDFKIVTFGIENKNCSVTARGITETAESTEFTAVHPGGKIKIRIPTVGIHNVYDALAALAVGLNLGISAENAAQGLSKYVPSGMRQKITKIGRITVIEDCYNASPDSQRAGLNSLCKLAKGRKIAVLGDMLELGSYSETAHRAVGEYAAKCGIDALLTYGEQSKFMAAAAYEAGLKNTFVYTDKKRLTEDLRNHVLPGDTVLFKASRGMRLEEVFLELYKYWEV